MNYKTPMPPPKSPKSLKSSYEFPRVPISSSEFP
jgi:hypothetical protein